MTLRVLELAKRLPRNAVTYAYGNTRLQFHPALYVVLYAGLVSVLNAACFWPLSLVMSPSMSVDWEAIGYIAGPLAVGKLIRGHVRRWLGRPLSEWSAMAGSLSGG